MKERFYGRVEQTAADDAVMRQAEEVAIRGFTVLEGLYDAEALAAWRERIDSAYAEQEREFGRDALAAIQDLASPEQE